MMDKRLYTFLLLFFMISVAYPGNDLTGGGLGKYRMKLVLLETSMFSMPCLKLENEFLISGQLDPLYCTVNLGYNFYSFDENARARGYHLGAGLNHYFSTYTPLYKGISINGFYQHSKLNDYLKYTETFPGMGNYQVYRKTPFEKVRYGGSFNFLIGGNMGKNMFIDFAMGLGVIHMETRVPAEVTQQTFVNGLFEGRDMLQPSFNISIKVGYRIF